MVIRGSGCTRAAARRFGLLLLLGSALLLGSSGSVLGAGSTFTFTVNTAADTTAAGTPCQSGTAGSCSLRQAIAETNNLPAGSSVIINLPALASPNTYSLTSGSGLTLNPTNPQAAVLIAGAGAGETIIDGQKAGTVLTIGSFNQNTGPSSNAGSVTIQGVTIQNGKTGAGPGFGGGIFNNGGLTLVSSSLSGNAASNLGGAIANFAGLTMTGSTVSGNNSVNDGAGIYNAGGLTVSASSFSGNMAVSNGDGIGSGAAIANAGSATVTTTTFSGNVAGFNGGAIANYATLALANSTITGNRVVTGSGGGILNAGAMTATGNTLSGNLSVNFGGGIANDGTLALSASTISGNLSVNYGSGIANNGSLTVASSTIAGNSTVNPAKNFSPPGSSSLGAGIANNGAVTLGNTIIANQGSGGDCFLTSRRVTDQGFNLDSDGSCGLSSDPARHNLPRTNPLLDPAGLADNGGPTQTIALQPGSPAIDAGGTTGSNTNCTGADQRGVARPQGSACDIGAYESSSLAVTSISTTLTGGGQTGANIIVPAGAGVSDRATLSVSLNASVTLTFAVYRDALCTQPVSAAVRAAIAEGREARSNATSFSSTDVGSTFYWQVVFSGDANNAKVTSPCGAETATIVSGS